MAKKEQNSDKKNISKQEKNTQEKDFLTVALGASAGGIKALTTFFDAMPSDSGMAFVVILHLSQTHESNLAHILQQKTEMKVMQVKETVKVVPNNVYVIPPAKHLEMTDGVIKLKKPIKEHGVRVPIDRFFRSMADAYGRKAVCIILSGTGADGTLGMKHVKGRDGFAIIQDPEEAEYNGMPVSAIDTKIADVVLPIAKMPEKLLFVRDTTKKWRMINGKEGDTASSIKNIELLRDILTLLRVRTGHDFSSYKRPTLIRRLARHLQIYETDDLQEYLNILRDKPEEVSSLLNNLLINVTHFFRDKEAFKAVQEEVIPAIFKGKSATDQVRIWVAGCSTGEEAYSFAILLCEYIDKLPDPPKVQLFASDVDEEAIQKAREGHFSEAITSDVSVERLRQFFIKQEDKSYQVGKRIREMILFAPHNVLRDPPFSRLDLVSCRNLMIYLNRETQEQLLKIFNFALQQKGILFLGSSETADTVPKHFSILDKKYRIYQCRPGNGGWREPPPLSMQGVWHPKMPEEQNENDSNLQSYGELHHRLIEFYAPPSILINEEGDILHLSESAGRYLRFVGGEPSANIMKAIHPTLLSDMRAALFTARKENKSVEAKNIHIRFDGEDKRISLTVRPVGTPEAEALILFEENADEFPEKESMKAITAGDQAMESVVRRMEEELKHTKDRMRNTVEQCETSTEELKASNEELQAVNEELRSTAEELETSKEELQSVNEELTTVNNELKEKMEEVSHTNSDLENLIQSTGIATIFLDKGLNIKRYTPAATDIFNLIPSDIGRPLAHITHQLSIKDFQKDAVKVLQSLHSLEREVESADHSFFITRFSPYRTVDDKIDGVVISFIDVTEREKATQQIRDERAYVNAIIATLREPLIVLNKNLSVVSANTAFYDTFKLEKEAVEKKYIYSLGNREWDIPALQELLENVLPKKKQFQNFEVNGYFEKLGRRTMLLNAKEILRSDKEERLLLLAIEDITERKKAVTVLKEKEDEKTFLLQLTDVVKPLNEPEDIQDTVARLALEHFDANRCFFGQIAEEKVIIQKEAYSNGNDAIAGEYTSGEFAFLQKRKTSQKTLVIYDIQETDLLDETLKKKYLAWNIHSLVCIEIYKNEQFEGVFCITQEKTHEWSAAEVKLLKDGAERTWAAMEKAVIRKQLGISENKYRTLFNSMDEGYCIIEVLFDEKNKPIDYRFLEVNKAFEPQTGIKNAVGKKMRDIAPEHEQYWFDFYGEVAQTGKPMHFERQAHALNHNYEVYAYRIGEKEAHKVAILFKDISERKNIEKSLRHSEENYRVMVNQAIAGIVKIDLEGNIIYSNKHFENMLGFSAKELLQKNVTELVFEKDRAQHERMFESMKKNKLGYAIEKRLQRQDGSLLWTSNYNSPIFDEDNNMESATVISVDISEQKKLELHKDEFIGVASHELKTPLTSVKAYTEILMELLEDTDQEEVVSIIEKLNKQLDRLNKLVFRLLDTSRITKGQLRLEIEKVDIHKLIEDKVSEIQVAKPNHQLIVKAGKELPVLHVDADRIEQVLVNLISNAVKYSPDADKVIISSEDTQEGVRINIRDFGMGLPPEKQQDIFDWFYRIPSAGNVTGFGLGLSISKEIIKLHGGQIGVEIPMDEKGKKEKGALFYFTLPYDGGELKIKN